MNTKISRWIKFGAVLLIALFMLVGCSQSEASRVLEDQIFVKHSGEGPENLIFSDNDLRVTEAGNITPEIEDPKEHEETEYHYYENVELKDGTDGEYIVEYEGEELFRFLENEDGLLVEEDGTLYMEN